MKLIFISGPYRAATIRETVENIRRAGDVALEVWKMGAAVICPHMNTAFFDGAMPDRVWLNGALEIQRRCDATLMLPDWEQSQGSTVEFHHASVELDNHPVFHWYQGNEALNEFIRTQGPDRLQAR